MRAGPKPPVDDSPLRFGSRAQGSARFAAFCRKYVIVPKGTGARTSLRLRDWQRELVGSVLDAEQQPRIAGWCLPRGQGKSTLTAALALYELMTGGEGATVIVAAVDERQAGIVFGVARRMVELHPDLERRVQVYKDRLLVPATGSSFACLPSTPASLEGLDFTLAIVDEIGRVDPETWQVIALASGKRERSTLIGIGTPGPREDNVLAQLRAYAQSHPEDSSQVYVEYSAAGFEDHPPSCEHCWMLANPALGDYLHRDAVKALLPPKMPEPAFRRARLCQFVSENDQPFIPAPVWVGLSTGEAIPDGSEVVISLDGSWGGKDSDSTALVIGTVSATPHFDVLGLWENPGSADWRVPVLEVEQSIREAHLRYRVREVVADPFRWGRSLAVLSAEGIKVVEFPQSPSRLTRATTDLYSAAVNGNLTHSGDVKLTAHVQAATVIESEGGLRIGKTSRRRSAAKVDLAVAMLMCHSRCIWLATNKKRKRTVTFSA